MVLTKVLTDNALNLKTAFPINHVDRYSTLTYDNDDDDDDDDDDTSIDDIIRGRGGGVVYLPKRPVLPTRCR